MRALILEDDGRLRDLVLRTLGRAGFASDAAGRIEDAEELLSLHEYDLLVLDGDFRTATAWRSAAAPDRTGSACSILMLTAMDDPQSTVEGLSDGADDYIGKPFDLDVLAARAHALVRRNERRRAGGADLRRLCGSIPARRAAWRGKAPLELTAREFMILEALMRAPGAVVSRRRSSSRPGASARIR